MDCDNTENNFDFPSTSTKRYSILKTTEIEKRNSLDELDEATTVKSKRRKSRLPMINMKRTIDESADQHQSSQLSKSIIQNESITTINTALNAKTTSLSTKSLTAQSVRATSQVVMGDISNKHHLSLNQTIEKSYIQFNDVSSCNEPSDMEIGDDTTINVDMMNEESCLLQKTLANQTNIIDYSYLPQAGQTIIEEDKEAFEGNEEEKTSPVEKSMMPPPKSTTVLINVSSKITDQTYDVTKNQSNLNNSEVSTVTPQVINNLTVTLSSKQMNDLSKLNNDDVTLLSSDATKIISSTNNDKQMVNNQTVTVAREEENEDQAKKTSIVAINDHLHPKNLDSAINNIKETPAIPNNINKPPTLVAPNHNTLKEYMNKSLSNMSTTHMNATIDLSSISFLEIAKGQPFSLNGLNVENCEEYGESLKDHLEYELEKMRNFKQKLKECLKMMQQKYDESLSKKQKSEQDCVEMARKLNEIREKIRAIEMKAASNRSLVGYFCFEQSKYDKLQTELKTILAKNKNNDREIKETTNNRNDLKEKIENHMDKLLSTRELRNDKEKFKNLCEKLFNPQTIPYKLEINENIVLSYFFDFVLLEIKAANIVNDMTNDMTNSAVHTKYLNYPLQKIYVRSTVNSDGTYANAIKHQFNSNHNNQSSKSNKVPVYLRYCIDLIMKDIVSDQAESNCNNVHSNMIMTIQNKKYKYVKDLPILVAHANLACLCATQLAQDLDYLLSKTANTKIKFDFDIKNHMITITMPSMKDACYFRLKLSVKPGLYYQEAIQFSIDQNDLDEFYEPNIERISSEIEGHYFENGSLRNYLKRLNFNI